VPEPGRIASATICGGMASDDVRIVRLADEHDPDALSLLVDLLLSEQEHWDHARETREELAARLRLSPRFSGENHVFVARGADDESIGLCWVVLFDPGNGLEAEIAELYVRPDARGGGIARKLVDEAMSLIKSRLVSFATVWTRADNPAARAVYEAAGFRPTEQVVLTWLPR
jgi:ribosomal protein S18 acetylase RimI-like enzyme